jgi:hypothetical protein
MFLLMTREGEIGMKLSAPGDSRGAGDFLYPLYLTLALSIRLLRLGMEDEGIRERFSALCSETLF